MGVERVLRSALPEGQDVEDSFSLQLDPLPRLVREARTFVVDHCPPLPPDTRDALLLMTSELVTNAVLHARTPIEVGVTVTEQSVLVTVHDQDLTRPEQQPYEGREGGWGLGLVAALAEDCAMEPHPGGGKTAWFRISRGTVPQAPDDAAARPEGTEQR